MGESYLEMAAKTGRCIIPGFGSTGKEGNTWNILNTKGVSAAKSLFEGIDFSWTEYNLIQNFN